MQKNIQADILQNLQTIQVLAAGEQHSELVWSSTRQWHLATIHKVSSFLMAHQYIIGYISAILQYTKQQTITPAEAVDRTPFSMLLR